jgi:hypothetical protein
MTIWGHIVAATVSASGEGATARHAAIAVDSVLARHTIIATGAVRPCIHSIIFHHGLSWTITVLLGRQTPVLRLRWRRLLLLLLLLMLLLMMLLLLNWRSMACMHHIIDIPSPVHRRRLLAWEGLRGKGWLWRLSLRWHAVISAVLTTTHIRMITILKLGRWMRRRVTRWLWTSDLPRLRQ